MSKMEQDIMSLLFEFDQTHVPIQQKELTLPLIHKDSVDKLVNRAFTRRILKKPESSNELVTA
jgi:predicted HAD superfamily phosphohydrolase YqeG